MSRAVQVFGTVYVKTGTGSADALEDVGFSVNGVTITAEAFFEDIKGDENGGDGGPPIEIQYFGEMHRVRIELNKWDSTVVGHLQRLKGGTAGTPGAVGTLVFAGSKHFRLLLDNAAHAAPRNYLCAVLRDAQEINIGSRHSVYRLEFTCYKDPITGVLYNSSYS